MKSRTRIDADVRFPTDTELEPGADAGVIAQLAGLYADMDAADLQPLWTQEKRLMPATPPARATPYLWTSKHMRVLAERAGDLITISRGGDRRVLALANPSLGGAPYATPTLWGAIQYLKPGESAPGHRHTPAAIRFVLEGRGTWTTVDGDACDMEPGDLVLTPPWRWHDHCNAGGDPMVWFDGLDLPLVRSLDAVFFEPFEPDELQPVEGHNRSEQRHRGAGLLPMGTGPVTATASSPLLRYRWADTDHELTRLLEESDGRSASVEYVHPETGAPVMPTLGCTITRVLATHRTATTRQVASSVVVVHHGRGSSVVDGVRMDWGPGDMFAVPAWAPVEHRADDDADLFAITDAPALAALGLQRIERELPAQTVQGVFARP